MSVTSMVGAMVSLELIFLGEILVFFALYGFVVIEGRGVESE